MVQEFPNPESWGLWALVYSFELIVLGVIIIGNHLKKSVMKKLLVNTLTGLVLGIAIILGIIFFPGDLKFFYGSAMIAVLIWLSSLIISERSDRRIREIKDVVDRIEEKLSNISEFKNKESGS